MDKIRYRALTFDDVLIVPAHSTILPREVSLKTQLTESLSLNTPLLSAAMDTVTESRLAIALAEEGGIGIIHKNLSIEQQAKEVERVKKYENGVIPDPITTTPQTRISEVIQRGKEAGISAMPVVEGEQLVGIVTSRDLRFISDTSLPVEQVMTPKNRLITVLEKDVQTDEVTKLLQVHRLERLLVVDSAFRLRGMITVKDMSKATEHPNASKDSSERLLVGAAVGVGHDSEDRIAALVAAGVDILAVDTAHGHARGVLDKVKWIKAHYPDMQVIGGNIATVEAALALKDAGADAVKVGIGPGSICTTRVVSGVGVPQISAIMEVAESLKGSSVRVIADGGIRFSGDLAKALVAGAHSVMLGSIFAGTDEAPGEIEYYQGRAYKSYRGMGSLGAMRAQHGSSDRYFQSEAEADKLVPEGVEGRVPYKGSIAPIVHQFCGGLRSSMGYTGSENLQSFRNAQFVQITTAGITESHVHDVSITKQAPNYRI